MEQRERMRHLSPCISPNIPSYASVATRNTTRTATIRSIQHGTGSSPPGKSDACGNSHFLKSQQNATRDGEEHENGATINERIHRNFKSIVIRTNDSQNSEWRKSRRPRDSGNVRGKEQHFSRERPARNSKNSLTSLEKDRILQSANSKQSSPKRSASTESCGMRSSKGVKSIKYVYQRIKKSTCRKKNEVC